MARKPIDNEYLSRNDVASLLGVTVRYVDIAADRGILKRYRMGTKMVRFRRSEVEAALIPVEGVA